MANLVEITQYVEARIDKLTEGIYIYIYIYVNCQVDLPTHLEPFQLAFRRPSPCVRLQQDDAPQHLVVLPSGEPATHVALDHCRLRIVTHLRETLAGEQRSSRGLQTNK